LIHSLEPLSGGREELMTMTQERELADHAPAPPQ